MPERVQLRRTRGWRMPPNTVSVARPGRWGNPFVPVPVVGDDGRPVRWTVEFRLSRRARPGPIYADGLGSRAEAIAVAVDLYEDHLGVFGSIETDDAEIIEALGGRNLACWCAPGARCHADVLLRIANP